MEMWRERKGEASACVATQLEGIRLEGGGQTVEDE